MRTLILSLAALITLAGCSSKPDWQEQKVGALTVTFPCKPAQFAATTKCGMSDGTNFSIAVVDKELTPEQQLAETKQYVEQLPQTEVLKIDAFPLKWRETRRSQKADVAQYYFDKKEYTLTVDYTTTEAPPIGAEFFGKVKTP
jgi:uncharacterized protein YceK